eukprot:m51a1_g7594 hypothetical protein (426) ;mRNA; f:220289-221660
MPPTRTCPRRLLLWQALLHLSVAVASPTMHGGTCVDPFCLAPPLCGRPDYASLSAANCSLLFPAPRSRLACARHCTCLHARHVCKGAQPASFSSESECVAASCKGPLDAGAFPARDPAPRLQGPYRRVAVFSTTIEPLYSFFAPITSLLWSSLQGYAPMLQLVLRDASETTRAEQELADLVRSHSAAAGALVDEMRAPALWPRDEVATLAQVARLYAFLSPALSPAVDAYLLTTDADIWPVDVGYFNDGLDPGARLHVLYANAYAGARTLMYPICYLGANASAWREIMRPRATGVLAASAAEVADGRRAYGEAWGVRDNARSPRWYYDQLLFGQRVAAWDGHPGRCQRVQRAPQRDRIDQGALAFNGSARELAGKIDSHVLRPGHEAAQWRGLRKLLAVMLAPEQLAWVEGYRKKFNALVRSRGL